MHLSHLPHHDGSRLHCPDAARLGEPYRVRLFVPQGYDPLSTVYVRVLVDREARYLPLTREGEWWTGSFIIENPATNYRFLLNRDRRAPVWLTATGLDEREPRDDRDFRVSAATPPPSWAREQVMYQIVPDRFARSAGPAPVAPDWALPAAWDDAVVYEGPDTPRQFFGGDLDGVTEHLDHLERIGATLIYLTPFFPAGSTHRYDATSFDEVDPVLGGDAALVRLVAEAHARGIRVVGDLTTNHTGDRHEWFQSAYGTPGAPESEFYYWRNKEQTEYAAWYDVPSLPKLNWNSPELRRRFIDGPDSVVGRWLQPPFDLDGWRIDVANMTGRFGEDDLNAEIQRTIRSTMSAVKPDSVLFAESTNDAAADFGGEGWQGAMTYTTFTRPVWQWLRSPELDGCLYFGIPYEAVPTTRAADVVRANSRFTAGYPWPLRETMMNALDTHDLQRFAHHAGPEEQLVALALAVGLPGIPVVYAGDEFRLRGVNGEDSRTPMPWGARHDEAFVDRYAELLRLRATQRALCEGGLRHLYMDDHTLVFERTTVDGGVLVAVSSAPFDVAIGGVAPTDRLAGNALADSAASSARISGEAMSWGFWRLA